jgi:uncharacterized protein
MENLNEPRPQHSVVSIIIFVATLFVGFAVIGPLVGILLALPFYDGGLFSLAEEITSGEMSEELRIPLLVMQGSATCVGLIVIPMLAYRFMLKMRIDQLVGSNSILVFVLTAIAVVVFMLPNSIVIEWNANLNFSGGFWEWAKALEQKGEVMTKFFTAFQSHGEFAVGLIIIAVLPAIGEEFAFRGWLQPAIQQVSGNPHVAIWISAALFSAFHFQFFGFVPRMLLGAMFGYLMYWSNNLWVPMVAHFVNNGFTVVMLYLHQLNLIQFDTESNEALPLKLVIPSTILFVFLILFLRKIISAREETTQSI